MEQNQHSQIRNVLGSMRSDARAIFMAGLAAADPVRAVHAYCRLDGGTLHIGSRSYALHTIDRILVVGAGKATAAMAAAVEAVLGSRINSGLISVKYGHAAPLKVIRTIEAGHPLPDANGASAARQMGEMVRKAGKNDLVIVLLSGGGSALLPLPADPITLEQKQLTSDRLISSGASIHEINTIRKHLSGIKGGRLGRAAFPAQVAALVLSDVVGDDLDVIASGPTVADRSTFGQCIGILNRYQLHNALPGPVTAYLEAGQAGRVEESPKPSADWQHVHHQIIGSNAQAVAAARDKASALGYRTLILSSRLEGETRHIARMHGAVAREILASANPIPAPACLLSGGETTVTIRGDGLGGRNQEFALAAAIEIDGAHCSVILSGGTDGTDGPTDAAGAIADSTTVARALKSGLEIGRHLDRNDAYPFFDQLDDLLITGPTQTNVMDLHVVLARDPSPESEAALDPHPDPV